MDFFSGYGLPGLFVAAFLAATILPFSSEFLLLLLIHQSGEWFLPLCAASLGNILGSVTNYLLGLYGESFLFYNLIRMSEKSVKRARTRYQKYGIYSLLLAWVPIIGDPLTVVAGAFRVRFSIFIFLVSLGKITRYSILILAASAI